MSCPNEHALATFASSLTCVHLLSLSALPNSCHVHYHLTNLLHATVLVINNIITEHKATVVTATPEATPKATPEPTPEPTAATIAHRIAKITQHISSLLVLLQQLSSIISTVPTGNQAAIKDQVLAMLGTSAEQPVNETHILCHKCTASPPPMNSTVQFHPQFGTAVLLGPMWSSETLVQHRLNAFSCTYHDIAQRWVTDAGTSADTAYEVTTTTILKLVHLLSDHIGANQFPAIVRHVAIQGIPWRGTSAPHISCIVMAATSSVTAYADNVHPRMHATIAVMHTLDSGIRHATHDVNAEAWPGTQLPTPTNVWGTPHHVWFMMHIKVVR
ncbi:hypothetical protein WOLCODRAFT_19368 [Wolfiporia cocos MD-104 SS10]|uniref:Uncharacterized protein n=1 Tax=Wolfiporia cocos (strain MD-104) TaxID=742152 RepID=A0A2H3K9M0_WOLCO|nr:hypothetical protein WOLCODRAFT_19368 [Wolfiporia cocos MD-104 SS10]